ncbi:MAG: hypothetical protein ACI9L6_000432 [Flavobacterium sp.]|jgi:hypothetical protein
MLIVLPSSIESPILKANPKTIWRKGTNSISPFRAAPLPILNGMETAALMI